MSKKLPPIPKIPLKEPIPELTVIRANQLMCADNLRAVAKLIEAGSLTAFDIAWNSELHKPVGKMVIKADFLIAPVESQFMREVDIYKQAQENKIQLQDLSQDLQNHEPCGENERDKCSICTTKGS